MKYNFEIRARIAFWYLDKFCERDFSIEDHGHGNYEAVHGWWFNRKFVEREPIERKIGNSRLPKFVINWMMNRSARSLQAILNGTQKKSN